MGRPDAEIVGAAISWFRSHEFHAEKIEEDEQHPSPDLWVTNGSERYLVEVKTKEDDPDKQEVRRERFHAGEIVDVSEPLARWNTIDGIVGDAVEQLAARASDDDVLRLVLFHCGGSDPGVQVERIISTAYGKTEVVDFDGDDSRPGYYVRESAFFTNRGSLDGIIVEAGGTSLLLVNTLSPRYRALSESYLSRVFRDAEALVDPGVEEAAGQAYLADCTVPRRDEQGVAAYLQRKYGKRKLLVMELGVLGAVVRVPRGDRVV